MRGGNGSNREGGWCGGCVLAKCVLKCGYLGPRLIYVIWSSGVVIRRYAVWSSGYCMYAGTLLPRSAVWWRVYAVMLLSRLVAGRLILLLAEPAKSKVTAELQKLNLLQSVYRCINQCIGVTVYRAY